MKITFVLPGYTEFPIGGYKVIYEYANRLVRRGHEVTIAYRQRRFAVRRPFRPLRSWLGRQKALLADYSRRPHVGWFALDDKVKLIKVPDLDAHHVPNADAIFATAWQTASCVNNYSSDKGEKFYLIQHYEGLFHGVKTQVDQTFRYPMTRIVVSSWLQQILHQHFDADSELIINPIDFDLFYPTRKTYNRRIRICMFYHVWEWKGMRDGIEAFRLAQKKCPDIQLVLFGSHTRHVDDIDCEYHFRPTNAELRQIYNSCDIFLCPSWAEGFGLTSAEALACRCCLVSTDTGGNRDFAIDEETALLSPPKDPPLLAENLVRVIQNRELLSKLALAGFERVHRFTWEDALGRLETILARHS